MVDLVEPTLTLQNFLPYRCANLAEKISVSLSRVYVERFGISIAEWRIIATLGETGELHAKEIARQTNMDKVRVSRAVGSLESKSLLQRRPDEGDSRASLLSLTAIGKELYGELVPQALDWERALVDQLTAAERDTFFRILGKLESRLDGAD